MTISAAQVREALALLDWTSPMLAERAQISFDDVAMARDDVKVGLLGGLQLGAIRRALEAAGVEIAPGIGDAAGVRLRKDET